ncbi:MAG: energy transducer TonB [Labilithrix sp.]|nr:energy transducer TonB [Labilithrix sp.]
MIALAAPWSDEARGGLLRWLLPASVALHLAAFAWLPAARRGAPARPPPLSFELAVAPPPAPPAPEPEPQPKAEPEPAPARAATRAPATLAAARARPRRRRPRAPPPTAPMDFTGTVFSNDGPGLAVGGGGAPGPAPVAAAPPRITRAPAAPPPMRVVPPSSLARRPRAPGLDLELERQYPVEARRAGISGSASLRVRILPDGRVGEVRVQSESWTGFGSACERTVRAARWEPPIDQDGAPVATEITYTCRFEVRS